MLKSALQLIAIHAPTTALATVCDLIRGANGACVLLDIPSDPALADAIVHRLQAGCDAVIRLLAGPEAPQPNQIWLSVRGMRIDAQRGLLPGGDVNSLLCSLAQQTVASAYVLGDASAAAVGIAAMRAAGHAVAPHAVRGSLPDPPPIGGVERESAGLVIDDANRLLRTVGDGAAYLRPVGMAAAPVETRIQAPWDTAVKAVLGGQASATLSVGRVELKATGPGTRLISFHPVAQTAQPAASLERLLNDMPIIAAELDADLRFVQLNRRAAEVLQVPVHAALGRHIIDVVPGVAERMGIYRRALRGESVDVRDAFLRGHHFDLHFRPMEGGGIVLVGYDVTEREQVRSRLQHVADVLNAVPLGVVTIRQVEDGPGGFVIDSIYSSVLSHLPIDLQLVLGERLQVLFPRWLKTAVPGALLRVLASRESRRVQATFRPGAAEERHLQIYASWLADDLVVVTVDDISRVVDIQQRRQAAHRLEAVGKMAGGLAHDLNGRLTSILISAEQLKAQHVDPAVDTVIEAAHHAADLVAQLVSFAQQGAMEPKQTTAVAIIQQNEPMLHTFMGENIEVQTQFPDDAWPIFVDPAAMQRVLLNLAENARAAMPDGGKLTLIVSNTAGIEDQVCLSVVDTGVGMDAVTRERCFEPYFSKKAITTNSGLGLPAVMGMVRQAGGQVEVESRPGKGTTVRLVLPRMMVEPIVPVRISRPIKTQGARILLVEDEDLLRTVVARQLGQLGYKIVQAANAEEALTKAERVEPFDLLLTDVVMPGMNGVALARTLRTADPDLRVLFMSGHTEHAAVRADEWSRETLLSKPFSVDALREAVQTMLAS